MALDRIAAEHGVGDGMDLLMDLTGNSRSKVGKMDLASLRTYLDQAFAMRGQGAAADVAAAAVRNGLKESTPAGIVADMLEEAGDGRAAIIVRIKGLMAQHGITPGELS